MTLEWNDRYATGHAEVDAQHRQLFILINSMMAAHTIEDIRPLLMRLYQHTREHFQQEEDLLRSKGYPELAAHAKGHNLLLGRLNAFSIEVGQGVFNKPEMIKLVTDWAMNHIVHDDIRALSYIAPLA